MGSRHRAGDSYPAFDPIKDFSGSATRFGSEPNTQASLVDLGMPGVLPVLNKEAVRMAVKFGLAVNAEIGQHNVFARKNYFYPDLPKGYQISQMELPIVGKGHLDIPLKTAPSSASASPVRTWKKMRARACTKTSRA